MTVLVVAEHRDGKLNRATWETIAAAQHTGGAVAIAAVGANIDAVATELATADSAGVVLVDDPQLVQYTADGYVQALQQSSASNGLRTYFAPQVSTRDFAPALAARLGRPLITDVTALKKEGRSVRMSDRCFKAS